jgi:flagellin
MSSISASAALGVRILKSVNADLASTQNRIATGYKVNSAKDNAYAWGVAALLRSDIKGYQSVKASLAAPKATLDAAATGASEVADMLGDLKTQFAIANSAASTSGADYIGAVAQISALQSRINVVLNDSMQGSNLLNAAATTFNYTTSYRSDGTTTSGSVTTLDLDGTAAGMLGADVATTTGAANTSRSILTFLAAATRNSTDAPLLQAAISAAITTVTNYAATLNAASANIEGAQSLMDKLVSIKESAVSGLVDADMAEESAKLQALQIKQQLATQAISIANTTEQNVLRLFQ